MKLISSRLMTLLALGASALLMTPPARAATSSAGDIFLGVRAKTGTGSTKTYLIDLGQASQFENATSALKLNLGNVGADLATTFGSTWYSKPDVLWGIGGSVGFSAAIGSDPAKTAFGTRASQTPWTRGNDSQHGALVSKFEALMSAFNTSSSAGLSGINAVLQTTTDSNSWASFQPGGVNAGPAGGYSFAFFNPSVEATFTNGVAGAVLHFYRVKPPVTGADIGTNGDYLGRFLITNTGSVTFIPVAANGTNAVSIENATYSFSEASGTATVKIVRTGDFSVPASVTIGAIGGTATSSDYSFTGGVVNFAAGEAEKTQTITIVNEPGFQGSRTIVLALSSPSGTTIGTNISSTVTITEDIVDSVIDLVDAQINVNAEASTATISLVRSGGSSPVSVDVVTTDDSAVDGVNFTGGTQTVNFAGNSDTATAVINLTTATNLNLTQNKKFSVALANAGANTSIGDSGPASTVVRILAPDTAAPTVTITAPAANVNLQTNEGPAVVLTGTALDNVEVDKVTVNFNGVITTNSTTGSSVNWTRNVTAIAGLNTISVTATDARGHVSAAVTRTFTYVKTGSLLVKSSNDALGTVTPALTGANAYQVGKTYTFKATAKAGSIFLGWTVPGLTGPETEGPVLNVVYSEAILASPTITANFGAVPFSADKIGDFNGLVSPAVGTDSSNSTNGFMKLTLTKTGSFSGTLQIDGFKLTIPASQFTGAGHARFGVNSTSTLSVARGTTKPSLELSNVNWDSAGNTITGTVKQYYRSAVIAQSDFTLDRAAFSATNKFGATPQTSAYLNNGGLYTLVLLAKEQTNGLTAADYPQGDGVGSITITSAGVVTLTGKLADDTAITASVPLTSALKAPLFAQLYATKGSFTAAVKLNSGDDDSDLKATDSLWFRPWQSAVQWYPWGWEEGVKVDLLGASYLKTGTVVKDLPTAPNTTANAELTFSGGLLSADILADVNISPTNVVKTVTKGSVLASSFTMTLAAATGDISGTFTDEAGKKPKYVGKVYQKGSFKGAHGYFMSFKPTVVDGLGESGNVSLLPLSVNN